MALEPDRHREIIPTSYFATRNGGNGRNEGGNGRNGRNEKMEEIVAETASRICKSALPQVIIHYNTVLMLESQKAQSDDKYH